MINPSDRSNIYLRITPHTVSKDWSTYSAGAVSNALWPTANKAFYFPFQIDFTLNVAQLFVLNGTAVANSFDIGIYSASKDKIISTGSTLQAGTSTCQKIAAAVRLPPGQYFLAMVTNGTATAQYFRHNCPVGAMIMNGAAEQTTAFPLPASATFATPSSTFVPCFGLIPSGVF